MFSIYIIKVLILFAWNLRTSVDLPQFDAIQKTTSPQCLEFDFQVVCFVLNDVFFPQSLEVPAFLAGCQCIFHSLSIDADSERIFAVLLSVSTAQQIGCRGLLAEDVGKDKLYLVDTLRYVEAVGLDTVAQSLEQRTVCRVPYLGLCTGLLAALCSPSYPMCRVGREPRSAGSRRR